MAAKNSKEQNKKEQKEHSQKKMGEEQAKEKKLDIIIKERKLTSSKKTLPVFLAVVLVIAAVIFMINWSDNLGSDKTQGEDLAENGLQDQAGKIEQNKISENTNSPFVEGKDVAEVVDARQSCSIEEAQALIKSSLKTESSSAYIVSYVQNFETPTYVPTYKEQECKIYAPTKQQFKAFLTNRNYYQFKLEYSAIFVDYGAEKKTEQAAYDLIMRADMQNIISKLQIVEPEGNTEKYIYNSSGIQKQSY